MRAAAALIRANVCDKLGQRRVDTLLNVCQTAPPGHRHDICQKNYATAVLGARILRKKHVNRDISQFATKERKCFKMA